MNDQEQNALPDPNILKELLWYKMPYGKYKGRRIRELPAYYLEWFSAQGFPDGKLGIMLSTMFIIKTHGLDDLLDQIERMENSQ